MGCVCSRQTEPEMQIKFDKNEGKEKQENSNGRIKESYNNFLSNFNEKIHYKNLFNNIIKSVSNQKAYEIIMQYYITPISEIKQNLSIIPAQVNNSFLFPCININETFFINFIPI